MAVTRKSSTPIKVYCLPCEKKEIESKADSVGLPVSSFLLKVALGYELKNSIDYKSIMELAKVNGDLGRLGGLLKMWLSNDERFVGMSPASIRTLLQKIEDTQNEMRLVMRLVVGEKKNENEENTLAAKE